MFENLRFVVFILSFKRAQIQLAYRW